MLHVDCQGMNPTQIARARYRVIFAKDAQELEAKLKEIGSEFPEVVDVHEVMLKSVREHLFLSCHVTMHDDLPLSRVHDVQTALEIRFKNAAPQLFRVLIHPEPQTDNRR